MILALRACSGGKMIDASRCEADRRGISSGKNSEWWAHLYSSIRKAEARRSLQIQERPGLHRKFQASHMERRYLKNK